MQLPYVVYQCLWYDVLYNSLPDPNQMIGHARSRVIHL